MKTIQEQIEVMTHFMNGGDIELGKGIEWSIIEDPQWNWCDYDYRIKEQKQTITIEKWLVFLPNEDEYKVIETSNIKSYEATLCKVIKLLDTYKVEL